MSRATTVTITPSTLGLVLSGDALGIGATVSITVAIAADETFEFDTGQTYTLSLKLAKKQKSTPIDTVTLTRASATSATGTLDLTDLNFTGSTLDVGVSVDASTDGVVGFSADESVTNSYYRTGDA